MAAMNGRRLNVGVHTLTIGRGCMIVMLCGCCLLWLLSVVAVVCCGCWLLWLLAVVHNHDAVVLLSFTTELLNGGNGGNGGNHAALLFFLFVKSHNKNTMPARVPADAIGN
jgi:hypothetical protein